MSYTELEQRRINIDAEVKALEARRPFSYWPRDVCYTCKDNRPNHLHFCKTGKKS